MELSRSYLHLFLLVIGSAFLPFLIHLLLVRLLRVFRNPAERQKGPIYSCGIGLVLLTAGIVIWGNADDPTGLIIIKPGPLIFALGSYLFFGYVYFHFFNMSETARRVRILLEGSRAPTIRASELNRSYTGRGMITVRLKRLVSLGEIREERGKYHPGRGILILPAYIIAGLHNFLFPGGND